MRLLFGHLRTLFILGRISNLPTVWSNVLVGWVIADGPWMGPARINYVGPNETFWPLFFLLLGGSFLYMGGMYLNDYCDASFDARYCPARPVPAGKIARRTVGLLAILWFTAGCALFTIFGPVTIGFALVLVAAIILYDFHHKDVAWAPLLMGFCRCLLYLLAYSAFREAHWFDIGYGNWWDHASDYLRNDFLSMAWDVIKFLPLALPLGLYVAGITYVARNESKPGKASRWPFLLFLPAVVVPIGIEAYCFHRMHWMYAQAPSVVLAALLLVGWMAWLLVPLWRKTSPSIGRTVSGLLAGIILLDLNMAASAPFFAPLAALVVWFPLFLLALLLQRFIPAT